MINQHHQMHVKHLQIMFRIRILVFSHHMLDRVLQMRQTFLIRCNLVIIALGLGNHYHSQFLKHSLVPILKPPKGRCEGREFFIIFAGFSHLTKSVLYSSE